MKNTLLAFIMALCFSGFAQTGSEKKEQIAKKLDDYFLLERENIHVHFDKNVFTTNESIWFKGYVYHRKKGIPFFNTINIYAALTGPDGKIIDTQLIYGNIGSFTGSFKLKDSYASGKYYLQFYTNWMNNFSEDESAVYKVTVVNPEKGAGNALAKASTSSITISLNPEGGTFLQGVNNILGINVYDCNKEPLNVSEAEIIDAAGKPIKKVQLNKLGYGRFDIVPTAATAGYKAVVTIDGKKHEQPLPVQQVKGVALEVNNYALAGKTIVKVRTGNFGVSQYESRPLYLVVHQDNKTAIYDIDFSNKKNEQVLVLPNEEFFEGTNTVRVIDADMNELASRLIFTYPQAVLTAKVSKSRQDINETEYTGSTNYPNMNLSVSILPENTISFDESNDIYGSLQLQPYIDNYTKAAGKYYFSTLSKGKHYELDLFLLNQKPKYAWYNIMNNAPKDKFQFDMGLTLKGTVNLPGDHRYSKIRMYSPAYSLDVLADINEKNEFVFNNLIVPDSANVNFTLLKKGAEPKPLTIAPQLLNSKRPYYKMHKPDPPCETYEATEQNTAIPGVFDNTVQLEAVAIERSRLKYATSYGNSMLKGYKIEEADYNYNYILNYLRNFGFYIEDNGTDVIIRSTTRNSINAAQSSPALYIDNIQQYDYSMLRVMRMNEIDEIYVDRLAIIPSVRNFQGVIKIYLNPAAKAGSRKGSGPVVIQNAFTNTVPFEPVNYTSTNDKGFENFGLIDWEPVIMTDEKGGFKFAIPRTYPRKIKVLIEGFSADGKLISEIKTLEAN